MQQGDVQMTEEFVGLRPLLISLAYRMTGSVAEAEDIVSESYLRLERARSSGTQIDALKPYLSTVVTRLSIDHLRSARVRREAYVGPWLPEPLLAPEQVPEVERVELSDTLSMAFLVLLETLSPTERAVFLLRDVFGFDYPEISRMVGKSEPNCRQLLVRSRRHIEDRKPRFEADIRQRDELAGRFFAALEDGDLAPLVTMLADDVVAYGDGGGTGPALSRPINGKDKVLTLLTAVSKARREFDLHFEVVQVNGQPGALFLDSTGRLLNVLSLDIVDGAIQTLRSVVNPDKLHHLGPVLDPDHPIRRGGGVAREIGEQG